MRVFKNIILVVFLLVSFTGYSQCIEGDCFNGYGTFKCSCGYTFVGDFKDGQKVKGTLTKEDLVYTGEFKDDVAEGQGVIKFIDSTWYEGSFINNFPEGYGTFHFADGTTYTGEMFEGKFKGIGVMNYPVDNHGNELFKMGEFIDDEMEGFGILIDSNQTYFGQIEGGIPNGFGIFLVDSGVIVGGKVKKQKVTKPFELEHDEEYANFGSRPMKIGDELYWVEGKMQRSELVIASENTDRKKLRIYFSKETYQMFISSYETYPLGNVIDLEGRITKAKWNEKNREFELIED